MSQGDGTESLGGVKEKSAAPFSTFRARRSIERGTPIEVRGASRESTVQ